MGSCNAGDPIAEDSIHTDITTCNIEEAQQKYRLRTVSSTLLGEAGGGGLKTHFSAFMRRVPTKSPPINISFPYSNIKGFSYLSDYECHKTPTLQPLPV